MENKENEGNNEDNAKKRSAARSSFFSEKEADETRPLPLLGDVRMDPDPGVGSRRGSGSRTC